MTDCHYKNWYKDILLYISSTWGFLSYTGINCYGKTYELILFGPDSTTFKLSNVKICERFTVHFLNKQLVSFCPECQKLLNLCKAKQDISAVLEKI